jgi:NAD-dependent deacetylase
MSEDEVDLKSLLARARRVVAFTGAGISAESGIPTYRGDDGVWNKYDPTKYAEIGNFLADPDYYWSFFREVRYPVLRDARPNPAHLALARLEQRGRLSAVITQNIDGLHQEAGSGKVLELHGNSRRISCLGCRAAYSLEQVHHRLQEKFPPDCPACGGVLKPEVVFFGESLPSQVLDEAVVEARACDLFLVVGSSLVVQPAASLPVSAAQNGARLVIINRDPTPLDHAAHAVFREKASEVLGSLEAG